MRQTKPPKPARHTPTLAPAAAPAPATAAPCAGSTPDTRGPFLRAVFWRPRSSFGSAKDDTFKDDDGRDWQLERHVSFVDCPGHDILMATMLNGAAVMDAALLLIAGNESCPQPQTSEHLAASEIMKLKHIMSLQNQTDRM